MKESNRKNIVIFEGRIKFLFSESKYPEVIDFLKDISEIDITFSDHIYSLIVISYFRTKDFLKAVAISSKIDRNELSKNYLLNEVLGESSYQLNNLKNSLNFYEDALKIKPDLKSATVKILVLRYRLGYTISDRDIKHALAVSEKSKKIEWIRDIAYIYYSLGNYDRSNYCLETIVRLEGKLGFIDQLTYSLRGIDPKKNYVEFLLSHRKDNKLYSYKHINNKNSKLVVIVSPHYKYLLQGYKFDDSLDLLFIGDATSSYYTFTYEKIAVLIANIVTKYSYTNITLVGVSKGGTGCLLMYPYLSNNISIPIKCIAFSPQINLYPFNKNLIIPSYRDFIKNCEINDIVKSFVMKAHSIKDIVKRKSDEIIVVYGKKYKMDVIEISSLNKNPSISFIALDYSAHATIIPFTIPFGKTYEDLRLTYSKLNHSTDKDFTALGGIKTINIVDEIWALYQNSDIDLNKII